MYIYIYILSIYIYIYVYIYIYIYDLWEPPANPRSVQTLDGSLQDLKQESGRTNRVARLV